jgi:ATP-dependent helicase IRC3
MHLRPYQTQAITAVQHDWSNGLTDTLLVAATGAGKTQMFLRLLMDALGDPFKRGLILAHRQELIDQPLERIRQMDEQWLMAGALDRPRVGVLMAERDDTDRQLTIATVQTLASDKRMGQLLAHGPIDYLVVDECHHATAPTYIKVWNTLKAANPALRHLGVTATPMRADGDGLAKVYQKDSAKITIADLVRLGYLVQPRWLGISTGISIAGVKTQAGDFVQSQLAQCFDTETGRAIIVGAYQEYAASRRAIAFTASVAGAHDLAAAFGRAGIAAAAVDGTTPKDERRRILDAFRRGEIQIVANCQVLTEGFDAPGTSCILMCRPTRSDSLYVQCMGRGLRPALGMAQPGEDCLILDFLPAETRNIVMAGDVLGLPKEVTREIAKKDTEPGEVQAGFTFDGEHFNAGGTPLEIIARQLDYLQASPFVWYRKDGWLTLGLGTASDNNERILVIAPNGPPWRLYGLLRPKTEGAYWRQKLLAEHDDLAQLGEEGNTIAARWGSGALIGKGKGWHSQPASDGQRHWLKKLARGEMKARDIDLLSKQEAMQLITHFQAARFLDRRTADALYEVTV